MSFVHLHVHSEYSVLDGLSKVGAIVARAKELGQPAVAITDHGAMYGVIDFFNAARKAGVKPLIGMEGYLARRTRHDRDPQKDKSPYHLLLLAQNQIGYQNLLKLATISQLEGYYYRPRVDKDVLAQYNEGVIVTTGCGAAEIPRYIMDGQLDEARKAMSWYLDVFGRERFFIELQLHEGFPELIKINRQLLQLAKEFDVRPVATNDAHYVKQEDAPAQDIMLCIGTGTLVSQQDRMRMTDNSYYLKSEQEMAALFPEVPEALHNTVAIAEMCEVDLSSKGYHLPVFELPEGVTADQELRRKCEVGLALRYGERANDPEVRQRLDYELEVIHKMGFDTYFLIVSDLTRFAQEQDIWWNIRGSGASSIVAYTSGITNLDPLPNKLIFERFLNPGRISMPDIDMDFPDDRRAEMINYAVNKYGKDKVAQIITFGTLGARAAIRDTGRALDIPLPDVDRVAKLVPNVPGKPVKISEAIEQIPELKQLYDSTDWVKSLLDTAQTVEGTVRNIGTHAAGVVISDRPLVEYTPLARPTKESDNSLESITQFEMGIVDSIGLLKVDFLGLATLSIMRKACDLIKQNHGVELNLNNIPVNDRAAFQLMSRGDVLGLFQVEGAGMRRMLMEMKPSKFEHIIAGISLFRPGPMEYIPTYIKRLHGVEPVEYKHPKLEPILEETYGIIVYQEQIIQIAVQLAGYLPGEADEIRKAVGKKIKEKIEAHRAKFIKGAAENGVDKSVAEAVYADIEYFARYGFNKCLPADVEVIDADTGRLIRVGDLASGARTIERTLTCETDRLHLKPGAVTEVLDNGLKPVYRLTTQLGRQIEATANHPFYTFDGWRVLGELKIGEQLAVPRCLPIEGRRTWPDHEVIVLGHLLAEGNLCHPNGVYYYTTDEAQLRDYVSHLEQFDNTRATVSRHKSAYSVYSRRSERTQPLGVFEWAARLDILGKTARDKAIPDEAFELTQRQIGLLIGRMWEGDGHINERGQSLYYATASERLARQLQHLLLRLGIVSRLRRVVFPYRDGRIGYQVFITHYENLKAFRDTIACHFISETRRGKLDRLTVAYVPSGTRDVVPLGVKRLVRRYKDAASLTWDEVREQTGVAPRELHPTAAATKSGFTREVIGRLAEFFDSTELRVYAAGDVYWDKVISIEYIGEKQTYDLTVADTHNFVANDFIVHNSHAADYAVMTCQTAYLKAHYPAEYMTALMTVEQSVEKIGLLIIETRRMGMDVLPPAVNHSDLAFTIEAQPNGRHAIRFGMASIKGVGEGPVRVIREARLAGGLFKSLEDFCRRVDLRAVNRRALEALIKVGALENFGNRAQLLQMAERMMGLSSSAHHAQDVGQLTLFGGMVDASETETIGPLPNISDVPLREKLAWEKELIGAYVSEHPVAEALAQLQSEITHTSAELTEDVDGHKAVMIGAVVGSRTIQTKKGDTMGFVQLEDVQGTYECVVFPRTWKQTQELWQKDKIVLVRGTIDGKGKVAKLLLDSATDKPQVTSAVPDKRGSPSREKRLGSNGQPPLANGKPAPTNGSPQSPIVKEQHASSAAAPAKPANQSAVNGTQPVKPNGQPSASMNRPAKIGPQPRRSAVPPTARAAVTDQFEIHEELSFDEDPFAGEVFIPDMDDPVATIVPVEDFGVPQYDQPLAESTADYAERGRLAEPIADIVKREFVASTPLASMPPRQAAELAASLQAVQPEPVSKKNGNGHGGHVGQDHVSNGQGGHLGHGYAALPEPYRLAKVVISRSGDSTLDASRVGEVHHLLSSYPGPDRFCFLIKARGETLQLDFPNDTTTLDDLLIAQLRELHGVESVQVSMNL